MSGQVRDMTKGSPAKLILLFAVPLMLGNIFQQLYTMVDTIVVGQVAGVQALAALGAVEWIMWMVLGVSTGVTQGFSILISQHYGARKWDDLKKAVAHSYLLTAVTAVSLLVISQIAARWILVLLNTPENIIGMSLTYLRIVFCGIPIVAAYNIFASVLRALGNSRTPLIAMIIASIINVILDLVLVAGLHWGVAEIWLYRSQRFLFFHISTTKSFVKKKREPVTNVRLPVKSCLNLEISLRYQPEGHREVSAHHHQEVRSAQLR